jgi:predicted exporter
MSASTQKAMAGTRAAVAATHARCAEAVRRFDAAKTGADVAAVLTWARGQSWFWRSSDDDRAMREAHARARERTK